MTSRLFARLLPCCALILLAACGHDDEQAREAGRERFRRTREEYEARLERLLAAEAGGSPTPGGATAAGNAPGGAAAANAPGTAREHAPGPAGSAPVADALPTAPATRAAPASGPGAAGAADGAGAHLAGTADRAGGSGTLASVNPAATSPGAHPTPRPAGGSRPGRSSAVDPGGEAPAAPDAAVDPEATPAGGDASADDTPVPPPSRTPKPTPTEPPNSDAEPPRPVSIAFDPPRASDGVRVRMVLAARDNLSGPESASGSLTGPSGRATIYFNLALEGTSGRADGTLAGTFKVPPGSEPGDWGISTLRLKDKAQNLATLTPAGDAVVAAARFSVSTAEADGEPPALESIELSPPRLHDGGIVRLFVRASDTQSAVSTVRGALGNPSGTVRLSFSASLNPSTGLFETSVTLPPHCEAGLWTVAQLQITDAAHNRLTLAAGDAQLQAAQVTVISGASDTTPATLASIVVSPARVENGSPIEFRVVAYDDLSGVKGVDGLVVNPRGTGTIPFTLAKGGVPGEFTGKLGVPPKAEVGRWRVDRLTLVDGAGNKVQITATDPLLATAVFEVY